MEEHRFHLCRHCGNLTGLIHDAGVPICCCGEPMDELVPNTSEAAGEKHLPVARVEGSLVRVRVGGVDHPMTDEHAIAWVYLQTDRGGQRKALPPGGPPAVTFALADETPVAVYSWCSLHGLWKTAL